VGKRVRTGDLTSDDRQRVEEILLATGAFRDAEVAVALELFDETFPSTPRAKSDPRDGYLFLGAFTPEDELVGYACYGTTPDTDRTWDLYWIAVDPSAQGTGGGTTLLSEVERRVRGLDGRMLVVETSSRTDYASSRRFYEGRGYTEAARVRDFYAPADDRIIFTKLFPEAPPGRS
jgi:ribosomal protein S18 acetylase RimI-like enzyme